MIKNGGKFRGSPLIVKALELILLAALVYVLVRAILTFIAPQSLWKPLPNAASKAPIAQMGASRSHDFSFDPFHPAAAAQIAPLDIGEDAPETTLNLKLFGLRASTDLIAGSAVLQTPDRVQKNYQVGEEIISGVTLTSVSKDYIVLSQNGRLERLTFERGAESFLANVAPETSTQRARIPNPNFLARKKAPTAERFKPEDLLSSVTILPVAKDGVVTGYAVTPKYGNVDLSLFGLEPGDIITKIGAADLTQGRPEIGPLMASLSQAKSARLTIIRGGETIIVKVKIPR